MIHLLEHGIQNPDHIAGPVEGWEARRRMSAWKGNLIEAGLAATNNQWVEGKQDQYSIARLAVEHIIKINEEGWQGINQVNLQTILLSPKLIKHRSSLCRKEQEVNPSRVTSM